MPPTDLWIIILIIFLLGLRCRQSFRPVCKFARRLRHLRVVLTVRMISVSCDTVQIGFQLMIPALSVLGPAIVYPQAYASSLEPTGRSYIIRIPNSLVSTLDLPNPHRGHGSRPLAMVRSVFVGNPTLRHAALILEFYCTPTFYFRHKLIRTGKSK